MNDVMTGQFFPADSAIHSINARSKLAGFLILTAAIVLTDSLPGYGMMILLVSAVTGMTRLSFKIVAGSLQRLIPFIIIIFCINALFFNSENSIWHWWIFNLSFKGMMQGGDVVFRLILIILFSNILTLTTPPMEITGAIQTMLHPLKYIRIPVEDVAMILSVAIQFIPTLMEETDTIKKAQIARGARFESKRLHERAQAMIPLVVPIFLGAFKRADELAMAMEARGYRGAKFRTKKRRMPMKAADGVAITICAAFCAAQIYIF